MIVICCIDDNNSMLFNRRRQSQDRVLRQRILDLAKGKRLLMNAYSGRQFEETADGFEIREDFLSAAGQNDYCFVENVDFAPFIDKIDKLIIYKWNRSYPYDVLFPVDLLKKFTLAHTDEFAGYSHEKITEEIYAR